MKEGKDKILKDLNEKGDPYQQVLIQQLLDMKIKEKKRDLRKNMYSNPAQSYRHDLMGPTNSDFLTDMANQNANLDFKSHSLKNS